MKVVIMGIGHIGEALSYLMQEEGHDVIGIDQDEVALSRLQAQGCQTVRGVGFDRDVLLRASVDQTEAFAATSNSDNANIVAARIAHNLFRVPRVVARIQDPRKVEIYRRLGLITISPTDWGAHRIYELLTHSDLAPLMTFGNGDVALLTVKAPPHLAGHMVRDLTVLGEITVVAITRNDAALLPAMGTEFQANDQIHLAVLSGAMGRLDALLGLGAGG
ncbi:MAG TPA: TrkA family potassium uptake protein [Anaerolineales bacterium]|jgi:trk system potassium uptake protein TrkA